MKYRKSVVYLFTLFLTAVAVFLWVKESKDLEKGPISVTVFSEGGAEEINCWLGNEDVYYIFLPGYADLSQTVMNPKTVTPLYMHDQKITERMPCGDINLGQPYVFTSGIYQKKQYSVVFMKSGNISTMHIDVRSGNMDYLHAEKGNEEIGSMRLYSSRGEILYDGDLEFIKTRGNGTWEPRKKPYSIKLSKKADLMNTGSAQKWILLANAWDNSHLRNKTVYDFADEIGLMYSPASDWIDLFLNGEYVGVYLLTERNEVSENRVDLRGGAFLVSQERESRLEEQGIPYVSTERGAAFRLHYTSMSDVQIQQIWQSAENAILSKDGMDPVSGKHWSELIDLDSWARKFLIEEIFANADAGILSQFFYYDEASDCKKIFAGPVWDYDLSLANKIMWPDYAPNMFYANRENITEMPWYFELYKKDEFSSYVVNLWKQEFRPKVLELLDNRMESSFITVSPAAAMNSVRWHEEDSVEEYRYIKEHLRQRVEFLDYLWCQKPEYFIVEADSGRGLAACYVMLPGEILPELPSYDDDDSVVTHGWFYEETNEPFDVTQPIYSNAKIYLKVEYVE